MKEEPPKNEVMEEAKELLKNEVKEEAKELPKNEIKDPEELPKNEVKEEAKELLKNEVEEEAKELLKNEMKNEVVQEPVEGEHGASWRKKPKKSFANRNPPKSAEALMQWKAMKNAFETGPVAFPTFEEGTFYMYCTSRWKASSDQFDEETYKRSALDMRKAWMKERGYDQ